MLSLKNKLIIGIGISIGLLGIGYYIGVRHTNGAVTEAEKKAKEQEGKAQAYAEEAKKADERVQASKANEEKLTKDKETLRRRVDELSNAYNHASGNNPSGPLAPLSDPTPGDVDACGRLLAVANSQRELINKQEEVIAQKDVTIKGLEDSRAYYKKAYEAENLRGNLLEIALEAQRAAARAERWKGRFEGFAAGILTDEIYRFSRK